MIDTDLTMADLALTLGMDIEGPTLHEVLAGEINPEEAIYSGPGGVKMVPAGVSLSSIQKADPKRLEEVVNHLSGKFKNVLIDSPSGLGRVALTALRISDELVVVTDPVVTSLSDALRTKEVASRFSTP